MRFMHWARACALGLALAAGAAGTALAQPAPNTQFVPLLSYRVGPYAAGGTGIFGGYIDYMNLINMRDGGINGVKLSWEECETEYNTARGVECYERLKSRGGNSLVMPLSTGITYGLIDRVAQDKIPLVTIGYGRTDAADGRVFPWVFPMITTYWSQASAMVNFMGTKLGGMDKLKGKKIVHLFHDSAFGREPIPVLQAAAKQHGFDLVEIAIPLPGTEQGSQWLQIRRENPDFVILWGFGIMNTVAIQSAVRTGFPRDRIIGVWWAGAEEDVLPAGDAAKGYIAAGFNTPGKDFPVLRDIEKIVYGAGKGNMENKSRVGSIYHTRGVVYGIITVEAIRKAQEKFGKGKIMTGEQVRWGLENMRLDEARIKALGATGLMPPLTITCQDHEGSGLVKFQQWDGTQWKVITDWVRPDERRVRALLVESAAKYANEKKIPPRDCSKES